MNPTDIWSCPVLKYTFFFFPTNLVLLSWWNTRSRHSRSQEFLHFPYWWGLIATTMKRISLSPVEKAPENQEKCLHTTMSDRNLPGERVHLGGEGWVGGSELNHPSVAPPYTSCPQLNSEFLGANLPGVRWKLRNSRRMKILHRS